MDQVLERLPEDKQAAKIVRKRRISNVPRSVTQLANIIEAVGKPGNDAKPRLAKQAAKELRERMEAALPHLARAYASAIILKEVVGRTHDPTVIKLVRDMAEAAAATKRPFRELPARYGTRDIEYAVSDITQALDNLDDLLSGKANVGEGS